MTDETPTNQPIPDASAEAPTAPVEMPVTSGQAPAARQGIPAWAVISGAAAAGLIVVAGLGGYALGQANAEVPADLARVEAVAPAQPGPGDGRGDRDGRGPQHDWGHGHHDEQWGPDGSGERMGPRGEFDMRGPQGPMPQGLTPEDLQQLLDLLMQSGGR